MLDKKYEFQMFVNSCNDSEFIVVPENDIVEGWKFEDYVKAGWQSMKSNAASEIH